MRYDDGTVSFEWIILNGDRIDEEIGDKNTYFMSSIRSSILWGVFSGFRALNVISQWTSARPATEETDS